jgi:hypothetical protein
MDRGRTGPSNTDLGEAGRWGLEARIHCRVWSAICGRPVRGWTPTLKVGSWQACRHQADAAMGHGCSRPPFSRPACLARCRCSEACHMPARCWAARRRPVALRSTSTAPPWGSRTSMATSTPTVTPAASSAEQAVRTSPGQTGNRPVLADARTAGGVVRDAKPGVIKEGPPRASRRPLSFLELDTQPKSVGSEGRPQRDGLRTIAVVSRPGKDGRYVPSHRDTDRRYQAATGNTNQASLGSLNRPVDDVLIADRTTKAVLAASLEPRTRRPLRSIRGEHSHELAERQRKHDRA